MAGQRWTTPGGPENRFPFKKENVHHFLQYSGACRCRHSPTKLQSLAKLKLCNMWQKFFCIISQRHGLDVGLESSSITTMQLLKKLASNRRTLMTMVSVWWNIHHTHPTWLRAISGSFHKSNQPLLGSLFQGSKTFLKLCIQRWGPHLLQMYRECFQKWRMRMQRWIEVEGSYFEWM